MSIHADCGRNILWARRKDDPERFLPPLEVVGMFTIVDADGVGHEVPCFQQHICNPQDVLEWQERLRTLERQQANRPMVTIQETYAAASQRRRQEAWDEALQYECPNPRCGANVGEYCNNLAAHSEGLKTKWPHPGREKKHGV